MFIKKTGNFRYMSQGRGNMYRLKLFIFCLLFAINTALPSAGRAANSLSQFGITWTFDKELSTDGAGDTYQYGQFANGDYWVVGPVNIIGIDPASTVIDGRAVHGSMVNPVYSNTEQGYFSGMWSGPPYSQEVNAAWGVSSSNPLTLSPHSSLISTISKIPPTRWYYIKSAAVLTVLESKAPGGSFRPPYSGTDKTIKFNKNQLDYSLLGKLPLVSNMPRLKQQLGDSQSASVERMFERPWIDHVPHWTGNYWHPEDNLKGYGEALSEQVGRGALMLHLDYTDQQKETLLIRFVQVGIDNYGVIQAGGRTTWYGDGGCTHGRKWPILFAGLVLNDNDMKNIGALSGDYLYEDGNHAGTDNDAIAPPSDYVHFSEDDQSYYVDNASVEDCINSSTGEYYPPKPSGVEGSGKAYYANFEPLTWDHLGQPEHRKYPQINWETNAWQTGYRRTNTATSWAGWLLAAHIMEEKAAAKTLWNHDVIFDYQDMYMKVEAEIGELGREIIYIKNGEPYVLVYIHGLLQEVAYYNHRQGCAFTAEMWDTYRKNYGPVWPHTVSPVDLGKEKPGNVVQLWGKSLTFLEVNNKESETSPFAQNFTYESYGAPNLDLLRQEAVEQNYSLDDVVASGNTEFEKMCLLGDWIRFQIPNFGGPYNPYLQVDEIDPFLVWPRSRGGEPFLCMMYAGTFIHSALSMGWNARWLTIKYSPDYAGSWHEVTEIWSNQYDKWIMIDPTYNIYYEKEGIPLSGYEIRMEWLKNKGADMQMRSLEHYARPMENHTDRFFWIMVLARNNFFSQRGDVWGKSFQFKDEYNAGLSWSGHVGSATTTINDPEELWWSLNQTTIHLYPGEQDTLLVELETFTPNFDSLWINIDETGWQEIAESNFTWQLHEGDNKLQAKARNKFAVDGSESFISISMQSPPISNKIEIFEIWDYNEPANPNDLRYFFFTAIATDSTVNLVEVNTPAGNTFTIPNDVNTQLGDIQTWHYVDGGIHYWEYEAEFNDVAELDNYGDGTYTFTVHYLDDSNGQTTVWFGIPGDSNAIPQPIQEPNLTFPPHNGSVTSPVTFQWEPCVDVNATSIYLLLEKQDANDRRDINLPVDATNSVPVVLSEGTWEAQLCFDNLYNYNNADDIPVEIGKYSESDYTFTITLSPVGHWTMDDDAANTTVLDSSGNGNDGIAQQNTEDMHATGVIDGALTFNGITDYVDCGNDNSLDITNEITISAWVNPASFPTNYNDIVSKRLAYYFVVDSSGRLKVLLYPLTHGWFTGSSAISGWTWTHVAMRYDGSKLRLYVNNILDSEGDVSGSINVSTHDLFIGGCQNNSKTGPLADRHFNGSIDVVKIFDKALSVQEIDELYNEGLDLTAPTPDPMTWATTPHATGSRSISMTATTASDRSGVQYYFKETSGNPDGNDSDWQESPTYEDRGLDPNTQYCYTVQARDKSPNQNATGWSSSECATTEPEGTGLVAHWRMDDNANNTTVVDSSGNGNDGIAQQNTEDMHATGVIDGALTFNGITDYVDCGNDNSLDITDEITISVWVNPASFRTNYNDIVSKKMAYYFAVDSYGRLKVLLYPLTQGWFTGSSAISGWTHVVMRYDGSKLRLYVNNILDSEGDVSGSINVSTHDLFIGGCQNNSKTGPLADRHFNGSIDVVKIFDKALSVQEIDELYNEGLDLTAPQPDPMTWAIVPYATGSRSISMTATTALDSSGVQYYFEEISGNPGGSDSGWQDSPTYEDTGLDPNTQYCYTVQARDNSPNQNATGWSSSECATTEPEGDGLVGCWEFDEGGGSTAGDCSGNGNHGTLVNGPTWGQGSLSFDGVDDYVDCGNDNSLDITDAITISAWVNPASFRTNYNDIVSKRLAYYFVVDSYGRLKVLLYPLTQGWFTGSSAISGWTHVVMRYDGSKLRLYVNNSLDSERDVSGSINASTYDLFVGGVQNNSKTGALVDRHFNGSIDNVKIFDKALSVQEIQDLYNEGIGI